MSGHWEIHAKYLILFGVGDGIRTHDPNLGKVVLPGLRRPWPSPRHMLISLPARLLAEELQKVGISRGKGPVRSEGSPSIRSIKTRRPE